MIKRSAITVQSKLGHSIHNLYLTHEEGTKSLAVLFPGGDGSTDAPTLHYARKAALLAGCDVLSIEYSDNIGFDPEVLNIVTEESFQAVTQALQNSYFQLFCINKSIGHSVAFRIDERLNGMDIRHICYTPLAVHITGIIKRKCLVLTGTKDKWFLETDIQKLKGLMDIELVVVENAVHSLEIDDDYRASIKILEKVTDDCASYIHKYIMTPSPPF
jgi:hypothetical protein